MSVCVDGMVVLGVRCDGNLIKLNCFTFVCENFVIYFYVEKAC